MRKLRTSGSVGGRAGNRSVYPTYSPAAHATTKGSKSVCPSWSVCGAALRSGRTLRSTISVPYAAPSIMGGMFVNRRIENGDPLK